MLPPFRKITGKVMNSKTQAIIEMVTSEGPQCSLIKNEWYKSVENPYDEFRKWSHERFNVTRTKHSTTAIDDIESVSFYDPSIDVDKVNEFIKSL